MEYRHQTQPETEHQMSLYFSPIEGLGADSNPVLILYSDYRMLSRSIDRRARLAFSSRWR